MTTIAQFCVELLAERGPLSAELLGQGCAKTRVTTSRDPARAVVSALAHERRVVRLGDRRYARVLDLLEGRWLTTHLVPYPHVEVGLNLVPLAGPLAHGLPLSSGGVLRTHPYSVELTGPQGWLPPLDPDELLGVRLTGGELEVRGLRLDDDADAAGEDLARRVLTLTPQRVFPGAEAHDVGRTLLRLMHTDPDILREPIPPLCDLLPPTHARYWPCDAALFERWDPEPWNPGRWDNVVPLRRQG
jgi:hypothetical protein